MGESTQSASSSRWLRYSKIGGVFVLIAFGVIGLVDSVKWPFTKEKTITSLEEVSACKVEIGRFRELFFPHPGYVAEEVSFGRRNGSSPIRLARIRKLTTQASWFAVFSFTHRVMRMDLDGLEVTIPEHAPPPIQRRSKTSISTTVSHLFASGAVLQVAPRNNRSQPERFDFPHLHVSNLARNKPLGLEAVVVNSRLIGRIEVNGSLGPLRLKHLEQTKLEGHFQVRDLQLGKYRYIAGTAAGEGRFRGELGRADVRGHVTIPDFEVTRSHHRENLAAEYHVLVNGINGDVAIESTSVDLLKSKLNAHGSITGEEGKNVSLDVESDNGRIQDLLRIFVTSDPAPLEGGLKLRAHVVLPPGKTTLLKKVRIEGDFEIHNATFTHKATQMRLKELSLRASGHKGRAGPEQVTAQIGSHVELRDEVATLTHALFMAPGAVAIGGGTYNLENEVLNLRGNLAMHASLSQAATGIKSILAIPLDPFFKKGGAGAVLPVRITGTYSHPSFKMRL